MVFENHRLNEPGNFQHGVPGPLRRQSTAEEAQSADISRQINDIRGRLKRQETDLSENEEFLTKREINHRRDSTQELRDQLGILEAEREYMLGSSRQKSTHGQDKKSRKDHKRSLRSHSQQRRLETQTGITNLTGVGEYNRL